MSQHAHEVERGERFEFGANWTRFLKTLDDTRIATAQASLCGMLETETLQGRTFVDVGCGSGLFSLAARRLGAKVHSFDYDPKSVACSTELRRRYFPDDSRWTVEAGSALDAEYLRSLGKFDLVYSWGVLHHTGDMAGALANAAGLEVSHGGPQNPLPINTMVPEEAIVLGGQKGLNQAFGELVITDGDAALLADGGDQLAVAGINP